MLECARGCLEHGSRQILRFPREQIKKRRLGSTFWSHGASELDLPAYWLSTLSPIIDEPSNKPAHVGKPLTAGFGGTNFLPFLYPEKTLDLLHRIAGLDAHSRNKWRKQPHISGMRSYARKSKKKTRKYDSSETELQEELQQEIFNEETVRERGSTDASHENTDGITSNKTIVTIENEQRWIKQDNRSSNALELLTGMSDLSVLRVRYHSALKELDEMEQRAVSLDDMAQAYAISNYMRLAEDILRIGDNLQKRIGSMISDHLREKKSQEDWTDYEWIMQVQIIGRQATLEPLSTQIVRAGLAAGKGSVIMPALVEALLTHYNNDWTTYSQFYTTYMKWRGTLEPKELQQTPTFWEYFRDIEGISINLFLDRMEQLVQTSGAREEPKNSDGIVDCILDMMLVTVRHSEFKKISPAYLRRFYAHLRGLLKYKRSYDTLHNFLWALLWTLNPLHKLFHGVQAYEVFLLMDQFGGYRGEQERGADLARKLFWRLCSHGDTITEEQISKDAASRAQRLVKVFDNIRARGADHVTEYSALLFHLSQSGSIEEYDETLSHYRAFLDKGKNRFERGRRSAAEIYQDRTNIYRRHNDLQQVLKTFNDMSQDPEVEMQIGTYNLVISAQVRAGNIDEARAWFAKLTDQGFQPDVHTYTPFLRFFAYRGDIVRIRAISKEMEARGLPLGDTVIQSHVIARLQAGEIKAAEDLVWRSNDLDVKDRAAIWNLLIGSYALQGNADEVRRLLAQMKGQNIPFTSTTFLHRLRLWCNRRRPEKAEKILRTEMSKAGTTHSALHFAIVMKGYMDLRRPKSAIDVLRLMRDLGISPDWSVKVILLRVLLQLKTLKQKLHPRELWRYKRIAASISTSDLAANGPHLTKYVDNIDEAYPTAYFQFMVSASSGKTELERVDEAWNWYVKFVDSRHYMDIDFLPAISILNRVMKAYRRGKMWDQVDHYWHLIERKARQLLIRPEDHMVVQSRRYILCQPLFSYLKALSDQGAINTVAKALILSLLKCGFALDNRCWNQFIRGLIAGGSQNYLKAFEIAEVTIMPGWRGWPLVKKHRGLKTHVISVRDRLLGFAREHSTKRTYEGKYPEGYVSALLDDGILDPVARTSDDSHGRSGLDDYAISDKTLDVIEPVTEESQDLVNTDNSSSRLSRLDADEVSTIEQSQDPEGIFLGRPEYSTLVFLARAFLEIRASAAFEASADHNIRLLSRVAPTAIQAVLMMPRLDDELQLTMLRR